MNRQKINYILGLSFLQTACGGCPKTQARDRYAALLKRMRIWIFIFAIALFISCNSKSSDLESSRGFPLVAPGINNSESFRKFAKTNEDGTIINDTIASLDSTVIINLSTLIYLADSSIKAPLTITKIKKILNSYCLEFDFYTEINLPKPEKYFKHKNYNNKFGVYKYLVYLDTFALVNINSDNIEDAIIQFMMVPPYGSSHCYLPTKAIILSNKERFGISDIGFIPDYFIIEKIKTLTRNSVTVFGYDYDCSNFRINRHFRIKLKTEK